MTEEQPTVEEPKPEPIVEGGAKDEAHELLSELKKLGVDNPQKLQNMAQASSQSGHLANLVGDLKRQISELKTQPKTYESDGYAEPVDLRKEMKSVLGEFMREHQERQQAAQQAVWASFQEIQHDEDYPVVREVWDSHLNSPDTQYRLNTGQTTIDKEYNKTVRLYYRNLGKRMKGYLEGQKTPTANKPPHMESTQPSAPKIQEDDERAEKIKKATKDWRGTDSDLDRALEALLGPPLAR